MQVVADGLQVLSLSRQKRNVQATLQKLELILAVRETQTNIQLLLANREFASAMQLIRSTQDVLATDLAGVRSLRYLTAQLLEMKSLIQRMVVADIESLVFRGHTSSSTDDAEEDLGLMDDEEHVEVEINTAEVGEQSSGLADQIAELLSILGERESAADRGHREEPVLLPLVYSLGQQISEQLSKQTKRIVLILLELVEPMAGLLKSDDFALSMGCNEDGYLFDTSDSDGGLVGVARRAKDQEAIAAAFEWAKPRIHSSSNAGGCDKRREGTAVKSNMASRLRTLPAKYFLCVLRYACGAATRLLKRLRELQSYAIRRASQDISPDDGSKISKQWADCLQRANEKANETIARLVTFRSTTAAR